MRNCTYKIKGSSGTYTYELLVDYFYKNGDKDTVDFIYELANSKQENIKDRLIKLKDEYNVQLKADKNNVGDVDVTFDGVNDRTVWTTQTFIDSGKFVDLRGKPIVTPFVTEDFIKHYIAQNIDELGSAEAAEAKAKEIVKHWEQIAEDGIPLHKFLTEGFDEKLSEARALTKGTVYEDIFEKIYDIVDGDNKVFSKPRGVFSGFAPGTCKLVTNLNLRCKLAGSDEEIIGHIDNLIIDNLGGLHIVNYKITTTSIDPDKENKYKYQLALLKQMLANKGFNTEHMTLSIIPIRLQYNDDFTKVIDVVPMDKIEYTMRNGQYNFEKQDSVVKGFIASTASIDTITSDQIDLANTQIRALWPDKNITVNGIKLTVDEWIETNKHKIIPVTDKPGVSYKVEIADGVILEISDPARPSSNKELKDKLQENYEQLKVGNSYVGSHEILRKIRADYDKKGITSFSNEKGFDLCGKYFDKLFNPYMEKFGDKQLWEVVENDLLTNENIILFRNTLTGLLDIITISPQNLDTVATFRGGYTNILGQYIGDTEAMNKQIMKADYGNIEAFRTMFILNLVLDSIEGSYNLGSLQVISPINVGNARVYPMKELVKDFSQALQVINKNNQDVDVKNNFTNKSYQDSLDIFLKVKDGALSEGILSSSDKVDLFDWGISILEEPNSKEVKLNTLRNLVKSMEISWKLPVNTKALDAFSALNPENRVKVQLYKYAQKAMLAYDGINLDLNENDMSSVDYYMQGAPYIPSRNASIVTSLFQRTVDKIAENSYKDSRPVQHYLQEFYDATGYSNIQNSIIGNQTSQFDNLYQEVDGKRNMYFKNPYTDITLQPHEAKLLKQALFTLAKIRQRMFPTIKFDFKSYTDPEIAEWIEENQWYLEVPLTKASKSSKRVSGYAWLDFKYRISNLLSKSGQIQNFQELFENITSEELKALMLEDMSRMSITNPFALYDSKNSYGGAAARASFINRNDPKFFESNLETLLMNMIESQYQAEEMGTFLLQSKAILVSLGALGDVGSPRLLNTIKYITDYVTVNAFNKTIMEEASLRLMSAVVPGRHLATTLYIAGNLVSAVRDLSEGLLLNMMRSVIKYQTNISSKNLSKAYGIVVKNSFSNVRSINLLNQLNTFYRISNVDVARIQEVLATGRSGIVNYENWLYATMRRPDFINRMTLFVARMLEDGVMDINPEDSAYSLDENGDLKYNWKLDKRFSIYASGDTANPEYLKLKGAYFSAILEYNREHPEAPLDPRTDDLPRPYSFELVESIKTVANSIYGGYDKSVKSMYEHVALGIALGQFTTWMNGMIGNYFRKPGTKTGQYQLVQGTNALGELEFLDPTSLSIVVQKTREDGSTYFFDESLGKEVTGEFIPFFKNVPILGQGIMYTVFKSIPKALKVGYERGGLAEAFKEFLKEIWRNPEENKNLRKLISDLAMWLFMYLLFKYALTPAYNEYKKTRDKDNIVANAFVDITYGGWSKSYDGFRGAYNVVDTLGNNMNPPAYKAPANLVTNIAKFPFDEDKTFGQLLVQNAPLLRSIRTSYDLYIK